MSFIEFEPPGARGRGPGRLRSTTLLTPNTTNPQLPHPTSGVQKQKGKTGTMVSGNRKKCGQTGYTAAGGLLNLQ